MGWRSESQPTNGRPPILTARRSMRGWRRSIDLVRAWVQAMNQASAAGAVGISLRLGVTGRLRLAQCLFDRLHASGQVA